MSDFRADEIPNQRFNTSFRGYDTAEVKVYLTRLAQHLTELESELARVTRERDELEQRADEPTAAPASSAEPDEQVAQTLEEAEAVRAGAAREAETIVARAHQEAGRIVLRARVEGHSEVSPDDAAAQADNEVVREEARAMVGEARAVRERILTDLAKRRRVAAVQLEQLRAAREKLLESLREARRAVDDAARDLSTAEVEARVATDIAGRKVANEPLPSAAAIEAELVTGRHFLVSVLTPDPQPRPPLVPPGSHPSVGEPASEGPAEDEPAEERTEAAIPTAKVDDLFARLRADREIATAEARAVLAETETPAEPGQAGAGTPTDTDTDTDTDTHTGTPSTAPHPDTLALDDIVALDELDPADLNGEPPFAADAPDEASAADMADQALELIEARLGRALKRALQDEQSAALTNLRTARGRLEASTTIVPHEDEHTHTYTELMRSALAEAAAAGRSANGSDPLSDDAAERDWLAAESKQWGREVTSSLRSDLASTLEEAKEADQSGPEVMESVSRCYREWRTDRVPTMARDALRSAFERTSRPTES